MQVEDPLAEGTKYLKLLQKNSAKSLETHLLSFEINMRKQKTLLAFQVILCLILKHVYRLLNMNSEKKKKKTNIISEMWREYFNKLLNEDSIGGVGTREGTSLAGHLLL